MAPLLFAQSKKDDAGAGFNARFYPAHADGKLYRYADDAYKGALNTFQQNPSHNYTRAKSIPAAPGAASPHIPLVKSPEQCSRLFQ